MCESVCATLSIRELDVAEPPASCQNVSASGARLHLDLRAEAGDFQSSRGDVLRGLNPSTFFEEGWDFRGSWDEGGGGGGRNEAGGVCCCVAGESDGGIGRWLLSSSPRLCSSFSITTSRFSATICSLSSSFLPLFSCS